MIARALISVPIAAALCCAIAQIAGAATYDVAVCADHPTLAAGAFGASNSNPGTLVTSNGCRRDPVDLLDGLVATDRSGAANTPPSASAAWTIAAAPGTRLASLRARRFIGKRDNTWDVWVRTASGQVLETCQIVAALSCTEGALPTSPQSVRIYAGLDTEAVSFGVSCVATIGDCVGGTALRSAWAAVYSATATVEDPTPPTVAAIGGSLVAPVEWHQGVEQASVAAADASGIRRIELLVDGAAVAASDAVCDYGQMRPCPETAQLQTSVTLERFADGVHQVAARATDAAGQTSTSAPTAIAVDTQAPSAPLDLAVDRDASGGLTVRWRNPDQGGGAPVAAAHYEFCPLRSDVGCVGGGTASGAGITALERLRPPPGGSPWDLSVWLQDAAGHADRASAARRTIDPRGGTNGPPPDRNGGGTGPGGARGNGASRRTSPRLRVTRVSRRARLVFVRGTIARTARGRISIAFKARRRGRPVARTSKRPTRGRFRAVLRLPRRNARAAGFVSVRVAASRLHRAQTVTRAVPRVRRAIQRGGSGRFLRQSAVPDRRW